jgi:hypothetical protein
MFKDNDAARMNCYELFDDWSSSRTGGKHRDADSSTSTLTNSNKRQSFPEKIVGRINAEQGGQQCAEYPRQAISNYTKVRYAIEKLRRS